MKKISKIRIYERSIKNKWYIRIFIFGLICILAVMIAVLIKFYFDVNKESKSDSVPDSNIISVSDNASSNYMIFSSEDGLYGVKDIYGRCILEPCWKNIFFLENDRFAVLNQNDNLAVADSEENFITSFIFKNISLIGGDFLAGEFSSQQGFALLDTSGNIISDKIWQNFEYNKSEESVTLTDSTGKYGYKYEKNILMPVDVYFSMNAGNCKVDYSSDEKILSDGVLPDKLYNIFESACIYFSALLSENQTDISLITNEQYIDILTANSMFRNCSVKSIKNIKIYPDEDRSEGYTFSAEVLYNYDGEEISIENLKSLVSLHFVEDEDHRIILKSVNKKEL